MAAAVPPSKRACALPSVAKRYVAVLTQAGPPVADIAHLLGKERTLARLVAAAAWDAAHR